MFTLPKRLLLYHSAVAREQIAHNSAPQAPSSTLIARDRDPRACFYIIQWMKQGTLSIVSHHCTRTEIPSSSGLLQDACTLLCRMFALAGDLDIAAVCAPIFQELRAAFALARESNLTTPVTPGAVMEVWNDGGEDYVLWKLVSDELCAAFSGTPRPAYAEYERCIGAITPLRLALGDVMGRRIFDILGRRGSDEA